MRRLFQQFEGDYVAHTALGTYKNVEMAHLRTLSFINKL